MNRELLLKHFDRISDAPDAIARLRQFILELAVRGKLVEQDAKDEPASELLKRIQAEKLRIARTERVKIARTFPAVEPDEIPFVVPQNWEWVRVRQVTSDRGQRTPTEDFTYIDVTAINKETGRITDARVLSAAEAPSRARKSVRKGDVLYSCVRPYLLNIAIVEEENVPAPIASTAFAVLNGFDLVAAKYLWIALRSPFMVESVETKMRGQAYPAVNDSDFALLPLPLPPLAEQRRIVAKVDELLALCDRLEAAQTEQKTRCDRLAAASLHHLNNGANAEGFREHAEFYLKHISLLTAHPEQIKNLRQTILSLAVRGNLVSQDPNEEPASELLKRLGKEIKSYADAEDITLARPEQIDQLPFGVPSGWSWTRLSCLFKVITDGDHQPPPKADDGIAFLTIGNVTTGSLDFSGCRFVPKSYWDSLAPYRKPAFGDILYTVVGATYGRPALVRTRRPFCVQRHIAILKPTTEIDPTFACLLLASPFVYDQATQSKTGAAQPTVALRPLRNFVVPVPPVAEQHRIVLKVQALTSLCDRLEAQLATTQTETRRLLDAVLHEALESQPAPVLAAS
jgi:type I restriction enzyme, S subunit